MTEENKTPENIKGPVFSQETPKPIDELEMLKERAREMGIAFRGNPGVETLRNKIAAKMAGEPEEKDTDEDEDEADEAPMTKAEMRQNMMDEAKRKGMALKRVQIHNLNPRKADLTGEIITVGNRFIGTVRRMVPFGELTENGTHVEQVIYDYLKNKKFQQIRLVRNRDNGATTPKSTWVHEYNIVDMPPLTKEELAELRLAQEASERVGV